MKGQLACSLIFLRLFYSIDNLVSRKYDLNKNDEEASKLDYEVFTPPPPGCYTYTQTLYGWSQSWAIKHRNRFPIWCKSRIQTLNSHTFITKISKHRTTYTDSNANFIENSIAERGTHTNRKNKMFLSETTLPSACVYLNQYRKSCWSKNRSSIPGSRDILNDVITPSYYQKFGFNFFFIRNQGCYFITYCIYQ